MEDHVWHHNDVPTHVGQDGIELVHKTDRSVLGGLTYYATTDLKTHVLL